MIETERKIAKHRTREKRERVATELKIVQKIEPETMLSNPIAGPQRLRR